ncbi:hypothetical protein OROHE_014060 [Orobanche hederae]
MFCLKLALLASLPTSCGGLGGRVIYVDVESKFSSRRMIEMGFSSFPEIFQMEGLAQEMSGRILVLRPTSLSEFTDRVRRYRVCPVWLIFILLSSFVILRTLDLRCLHIEIIVAKGAPQACKNPSLPHKTKGGRCA